MSCQALTAAERPPRAAYELTAEGKELAGALRLLAYWDPGTPTRRKRPGTPRAEIKIIQPERPWCLHRARFFAHAANCPNPQHWCPAATRVYGDLRSLLPTQRGTRSLAKQPSLCESRTDCSSFIPECEPGTLVPGASKRSGIDVEVIGELRDRR